MHSCNGVHMLRVLQQRNGSNGRCPLRYLPGILLAAGLLLVLGQGGRVIQAQAGVGFACFPTCFEEDGRFLQIISDGPAVSTFGNQPISTSVLVPGGESIPRVGFFDGDTGKTSAAPCETGCWDDGVAPLQYRIISPGGVVETVLSGANMDDNAWTDFRIPVTFSGVDREVIVEASFPDTTPPGLNASAFKFRSPQSFSLAKQVFAFEVPLRSDNEASILYPNWPRLRNSTYDGTWQFFFDVPAGTDYITIWDGDMDRGPEQGNPAARDTDDPDTQPTDLPSGLSPQSMADACDEGVATQNPGPGGCSTARTGIGGPPDDDLPGSIFLRRPDVKFTVLDPDGNVIFVNDNPSGNREWEKTTIRPSPNACVAGNNADICVDSIPEGTWQVFMEGVDLVNLNAWRFDFRLLPPPPPPPCIICGDKGGKKGDKGDKGTKGDKSKKSSKSDDDDSSGRLTSRWSRWLLSNKYKSNDDDSSGGSKRKRGRKGPQKPAHEEMGPGSITFRFTAEDCSATMHAQSPGNVSCMDYTDGGQPRILGLTPVWVQASDELNGETLALRLVNLNEEFTIMGSPFLGSNTTIRFWRAMGTGPLQEVTFHTSCWEPLRFGDQFGAALIVGATVKADGDGKGRDRGAVKRSKRSKGSKGSKRGKRMKRKGPPRFVQVACEIKPGGKKGGKGSTGSTRARTNRVLLK